MERILFVPVLSAAFQRPKARFLQHCRIALHHSREELFRQLLPRVRVSLTPGLLAWVGRVALARRLQPIAGPALRVRDFKCVQTLLHNHSTGSILPRVVSPRGQRRALCIHRRYHAPPGGSAIILIFTSFHHFVIHQPAPHALVAVRGVSI